MTPEEINKKIAELLHSRLNLINGELLSSEELLKEVEGAAKEITDKVFEQISALPVINGWVARDENGYLRLYCKHPEKGDTLWLPKSGRYMSLDQSLFPDLKWPDPPIAVELPIIRM